MHFDRETFPSAAEAVFLVVGLFAIEFLISAFLHDTRSSLGIRSERVWGAIVVLGNGVLFSLLMHFKRIPYSSLFHASRVPAVALMGMLALPVLCIVPALTLFVWTVHAALVTLFPMARWEEAMFDGMMSNGVESVVTACLLAPVLEEMLFRGIFLRSFLFQYAKWKAILGSAVLFGLAHLNIYQFVVGLILGVVLGWLYERTRSLWPAILLHASYNSAVMMIFGAVRVNDPEAGWQPAAGYWLVSFALGCVGMVLLQRLLLPRKAGG